MRNIFAACALLLCSCASSAFVAVGPSRLDEANKLDASSSTSLSVGVLTHRDEETGFQGEASLLFEQGSFSVAGIDGDTTSIGARLGVRYPLFENWVVKPYLAAGLQPTYLMVSDDLGEDEGDFSMPVYATAGFDVPLGHSGASLGLSYTQTFAADFDLGDADHQDFDAGTIALVLGWSF